MGSRNFRFESIESLICDSLHDLMKMDVNDKFASMIKILRFFIVVRTHSYTKNISEYYKLLRKIHENVLFRPQIV